MAESKVTFKITLTSDPKLPFKVWSKSLACKKLSKIMGEFSGDTVKSFTEAAADLEHFIHCRLDDRLNENDIEKLFKKAKSVEKGLQSLKSSGLRETLVSRSSISPTDLVCDTVLMADRVLAKFLSPKVNTKLAITAIKMYLSSFGDDRFTNCTLNLVKIHQSFVKASSFSCANLSPSIVSCSLACEAWVHLLKLGSKSAVLDSIDKTLEKDPSAILGISALDSVPHLQTVCSIVYEHISDKLKSEDLKHLYLWPLVVDNMKFLQCLVKNDASLLSNIKENLVASGYNYTFRKSEWLKSDDAFGLSIDQMVSLVLSLITCDSTYNKMKEFIKLQKTTENSKFWEIIEDLYLNKLQQSPVDADNMKDKNNILNANHLGTL